jgi:hypothetical protein
MNEWLERVIRVDSQRQVVSTLMLIKSHASVEDLEQETNTAVTRFERKQRLEALRKECSGRRERLHCDHSPRAWIYHRSRASALKISEDWRTIKRRSTFVRTKKKKQQTNVWD